MNKFTQFFFRFWSYEDKSLDWTQNSLYILPSDSSTRLDLECVKKLEYEQAQIFKDDYENTQRKDKKLREANASHKK